MAVARGIDDCSRLFTVSHSQVAERLLSHSSQRLHCSVEMRRSNVGARLQPKIAVECEAATSRFDVNVERQFDIKGQRGRKLLLGLATEEVRDRPQVPYLPARPGRTRLPSTNGGGDYGLRYSREALQLLTSFM